MENFDELLKKYADFIVRVGVNPQPGQTLIINCPLEGAPLARLCVRSAYEAGARDVQVNWSDDAVARARMELGSEEALTDHKPWQLRPLSRLCRKRGRRVCAAPHCGRPGAVCRIGWQQDQPGKCRPPRPLWKSGRNTP